MRALVDGEPFEGPDAVVSVFDWAVIRGYGVFEVIRSYDGVPFRLAAHLDRLERSAAALWIEPPERVRLVEWVRRCAEVGGDCQVRIVLTGGGRDALTEAPPRAIVTWEPLADLPDVLSILPMRAPWHPATTESGFPGVKWTSYAPNMASTDMARRAGFDDALLLRPDSIVLEGPTFTIAWVADGRVETPSLELGILHSITRDVLREAAQQLGYDVLGGVFPLERLLLADEVLALSTTKQISPVSRVGEHDIPVGDIGRSLASTFASIVAAEAGRRTTPS